MQPIRVKTVQESDLRMLGSLARNIQRVLPVTQADIDAAAALGEGWVVWKVFEVSEPLDNMRGGTQLIIRQNSIQPGQNVRRVIFVSGPGGQTVVIRGTNYIVLPDAIADSLSYVKAFGGTKQRNIPAEYTQVNYVTNTAPTAVNTGIMIDFAKNYEFEVESRAVSGPWYILQSRESSSLPNTGITGSSTGNTIILKIDGTIICTSGITRTWGNRLYVKATLNNGVGTLYVKDITAGTEDTVTGTYSVSATNPTAPVYLLGNAGGQYTDVNSDIYMARIKENDTVVMDYVPARRVATSGFYDTVSGTFKTALTPANLSAGGGEAVPTPDAPMDIVSNNGVLKARHQSGLPLGYTLLEYIQGDGTAYIDLGISLTQDDEFELDFIMPSSNISMQNIFGYRDSASSNAITAMISSTSNAFITDFNNSDYLSYRLLTNISASTEYKVITNKNSRVLYQGDTLVSSNTTVCEDTITTGNVLVFNIGGSPAYQNKFTGSIKKVIISDRMYLIPAKRNADNVVGMYDFVSGQFFTNAGTGTFTAGNQVSDPVEIYTDGTVETINVHGKNLFDKEQTYIPAFVNANTGELTEASPNQRSFVVGCLPNTTYTLSGMTAASGWGSFTSSTIGATATSFTTGNGTITTGANDKYLIGLAYIQGGSSYDYRNTLQIEQGSTATTYEPYYNGGSLECPMLLSVGSYQDEFILEN